MKLADTMHSLASLRALVHLAESGDEQAILALSPGDLEAYNQASAVERVYRGFDSVDDPTLHPACGILVNVLKQAFHVRRIRPFRSELNGTTWDQFAKNEYFTEVVNACLDKLKDTEYGALFAEGG